MPFGDKIDVVCDGGITRGAHVLKALSHGREGGVREEDFICMLWRLRVSPALKGLQISEFAEMSNAIEAVELGCRSVDPASKPWQT